MLYACSCGQNPRLRKDKTKIGSSWPHRELSVFLLNQVLAAGGRTQGGHGEIWSDWDISYCYTNTLAQRKHSWPHSALRPQGPTAERAGLSCPLEKPNRWLSVEWSAKPCSGQGYSVATGLCGQGSVESTTWPALGDSRHEQQRGKGSEKSRSKETCSSLFLPGYVSAKALPCTEHLLACARRMVEGTVWLKNRL